MQEFAEEIRHKPPKERAAKIRSFLDEEGLPEICDLIKAQWNLDGGLFLSEYGDVNNLYVYNALDRTKKWRAKLEEQAKIDEGAAQSDQAPKGQSTNSGVKGNESGKYVDDSVMVNSADTPDAQQATLSQGSATPSASDATFDTPSESSKWPDSSP